MGGTEYAWPTALTPYIAVSDGRRALDWYGDVFGAHRRGDPIVMPDGSIGHAELGIGDAVLMLSEGSTQVPVQPPAQAAPGERTFSHTIHLQVEDVDATVRRARGQGAEVEREPVDQPYGRGAVIVDPFGHRWMLNRPPARATRIQHGDIGYVTMLVPDDALAKQFYGAVLGWRFAPGTVERGWDVEGRTPELGLAGGVDQQPEVAGGVGQQPEVQLCFRVADIESASRRVREQGGTAAEVQRKPYGLLAECVDNQGARFQLWQPSD